MIRCLSCFAAIFIPLMLTSCFNSGSSDDEPDGQEKKTASTSAASDDEEEEMSFPEALKLKRGLSRDVEKLEKELAEKADLFEEQEIAIEQMEAMSEYKKELEAAKVAAEKSLNFWRDATRESFVGVQLPEVSTATGEVYKQVAIESVSDTTISISHEAGNATVDISSLPVGLRRNLIHEPTVSSEIE